MNQGSLISSNGTIIKVEECRLERTQPLCAVSAAGAAPRRRRWSSARGSGAGGSAGDGGPPQLPMARLSRGALRRGRGALPGTLRAPLSWARLAVPRPSPRSVPTAGQGLQTRGGRCRGVPYSHPRGSVSAGLALPRAAGTGDALLSGTGDALLSRISDALDIFEPSSW